MGTGDRDPGFDRCGDTERGLLDGELDRGFCVGATRGTGRAAAPERVAGEERVEQPSEPERVTTRIATARTPVTEGVIAAAAFRITERLVRDAELLELLLSVRVTGVVVRVVLAREIAERALDLGVGAVPRETQDVVVVATHDRCRPSCWETIETAASAWR